MPRKYHGPLRPGERSAKVPRTNRKKTTKKASAQIKAVDYKINKQIAKTLRNYGENKFAGAAKECVEPVSKPNGTQPISYVFHNAGESIAGLLPEYTAANALDLFNFPQGDGSNERNGDYMYIRNSTINMEVQMLPQNLSDVRAASNQTTDFRVMVVKANRKYNKLGKFPDPGSTLFLTTENNSFGYDGTTASPFQYQQFPINKRQWIVYRDQRFTLSPPTLILDSDGAGLETVNLQNPKYPIKKRMRFKLPVWRKCFWGDSDLNSTPDNLDTQWLIIVQAMPSAYCDSSTASAPTNYRVSTYGTTSARDS